MNPVDPRIVEFIHEHHVLTLAVSKDDRPWCATCFYIYLPEKNMFVFTSDDDTRHIQDFLASSTAIAAGAIALETKMTGKIRGIQFAGPMRRLEEKEFDEARKEYVRKFPVALLARLELWGLEPEEIKMTDNRLGFGRKLIWKR
jgi:uncharacterized protein YhbP (UPF0306 family)